MFGINLEAKRRQNNGDLADVAVHAGLRVANADKLLQNVAEALSIHYRSVFDHPFDAFLGRVDDERLLIEAMADEEFDAFLGYF